VIKGTLAHVLINISNPNLSFPFYKEFLSFLNYEVIKESDDELGMFNGENEIWLRVSTGSTKFDREDTGINHIAFKVSSPKEVDMFCDQILKPKNYHILYDSPKLFPEFSDDYYAVYFEDPDFIKLEVAYYSLDV
jgi:catechol 2,3-dioxygenase-like lactoylglutathione lyase family enzyme